MLLLQSVSTVRVYLWNVMVSFILTNDCCSYYHDSQPWSSRNCSELQIVMNKEDTAEACGLSSSGFAVISRLDKICCILRL